MFLIILIIIFIVVSCLLGYTIYLRNNISKNINQNITKEYGQTITINDIVKKGYNKKVKTGSWLNTDEIEVKKYFADKFCGKPFSAKFYVDFFSAFSRIYKKENLKKIDKTKPILVISGKSDPVGSMGKSVTKLYNFYKNLGLNVDLKLYDNARHEILNEPIKESVYQDIIMFLEK